MRFESDSVNVLIIHTKNNLEKKQLTKSKSESTQKMSRYVQQSTRGNGQWTGSNYRLDKKVYTKAINIISKILNKSEAKAS